MLASLFHWKTIKKKINNAMAKLYFILIEILDQIRMCTFDAMFMSVLRIRRTIIEYVFNCLTCFT